MEKLVASGGIALVAFVGIVLFVIGVLGFLMPVYIYMIKNRMDIVTGELKKLNSALSDLKYENTKINMNMTDFISRLDAGDQG
ncbi:MAG: hypothetical protein A2020_16535 [Lentisphaerae bacterium GWF2_45_14]|nr:MAG: hypothetical protein A2020_16535 [Lentisphaerae bacterium GWF2_45_14]